MADHAPQTPPAGDTDPLVCTALTEGATAAGEVLRQVFPDARALCVAIEGGRARLVSVVDGDQVVWTNDLPDGGQLGVARVAQVEDALFLALLIDPSNAELHAVDWTILRNAQDVEAYAVALPPAPEPAPTPEPDPGAKSPMIEALVTCNGSDQYTGWIDPADQKDGHVRPWFDLDAVRRIADAAQADAEEHGHGSVDTVHVLDGSVGGEDHAVVLVIVWMYLGGERHQEAVRVVEANDDGRYDIGGHDWQWYALDDWLNPLIPYPTAETTPRDPRQGTA
ncbi:hypothetical protein [Streptomyces californicus]|uniref:hypothetical protein n=1 Tax=Streptomyces californicus TaxID=67351 RepID=UPI0038066126